MPAAKKSARTSPATDGVGRILTATEDVERTTIDAVRKFVDSVNSAFPEFRDDGLREKIIASAFEMVEHLVDTSNRLARDVAKMTEDALNDLATGAVAKKPPAKKPAAKKLAAKRPAAKKSAARKPAR